MGGMPKPTAQKIAEGNRGKRALNAAEPRYKSDQVTAPA